MTDFKRARQPEHKEARRQSLMAAATDLFDRSGPTGAGINAIAAQAGFTKSNVYRYFESREHVLLALFLEEFEGFSRAVCPAIQRAAIGDISDVADAITAGFISRPRLCKLAAIFGTVLEQNVSSETIQEIKIHVGALTEPLVQAISERIPGAAIEDSRWAFAMISSLLAGMWPGVIPSAAAAHVMAKPEFAGLWLSLEGDFRRGVLALLMSLHDGADSRSRSV